MVLVHAATQKHHFHVQLPKSTTMPGAPQLPSAVLLLFLMCSLDHDVAAFRGKWWRPQEFCRQFHKASPQTGGNYVENLLDFVKASFASPGHD
ncbi:hypothetical protein PVAP13_2NG095100 [Panicum virgatum]|uniref:Uncharacterized protein n=1 Tax=Panicum virgatum TaxID=38727 RepID=A0A8T0VCA9_PANVG|nr:hypothetical protein PVAP13_2NG095100 [Panicum virgatum]